METDLFDQKRYDRTQAVIKNLWANAQTPSLETFFDDLERDLMKGISSYPLFLQEVYDFFDTADKPLNPREFLHFWASLSPREQVEFRHITTIPFSR